MDILLTLILVASGFPSEYLGRGRVAKPIKLSLIWLTRICEHVVEQVVV